MEKFLGHPKMITNVMEDYLEAIYKLRNLKGAVRTRDLARELQVSAPSVTEMLNKLSEKGLITHIPYKPPELTPQGEKIARAVSKRHETLTKLLKIILVSERTAEEDACKIEHQLSPESIEQLGKLVEFVENNPKNPKWLKHFKNYCATGKYECEKTKDI
ncbi:MAG: metal-dependent transcriptional regulator [Candidatus Altiarchaeota archaeon]